VTKFTFICESNYGETDINPPAAIPAPYSPEPVPKSRSGKIRETIFKNYAAKSIGEVCDKLEAALYIERNQNDQIDDVVSIQFTVSR
jgi:hypothetical protein